MDEYIEKIRKELQKYLQEHENTTIGEIMTHLKMTNNEVLTFINGISNEYQFYAKQNAVKMATSTKPETLKEYFGNPIVDLGFLCQHHIKEIREAMNNKLQTAGHTMFHNNWLLYRGY